MRIRSLSHVGITVTDFERSARWFWEVFRLPLLSDMTMDADQLAKMKRLYRLPEGVSVRFGFLRAPKGGVIEMFQFSQTDPMVHKWNMPGCHHFTLDVKHVDRWYEKLSKRDDIQILNEPVFSGGAWWFFFRDPDGNLIELIDLRGNYFPIHWFGQIAGFLMRHGKFKSIYRS